MSMPLNDCGDVVDDDDDDDDGLMVLDNQLLN